MGYSKAFKYGNLWYKYKKHQNGSEHILASENEKGLEVDNFDTSNVLVAHDHYIFKNGQYYSQTKTNNSEVFKVDNKNHIFKHNSPLPTDTFTQQGLEVFFENIRNQVKLEELKNEIIMNTIENSPEGSNISKADYKSKLKVDYGLYRKDIANTLGAMGKTANLPDDQLISISPSMSTREFRADIEYLKEMYRKINNYREDTKDLINKVSEYVMAQSEGKIWSDFRQYNFVHKYIQPIHESLKHLINIDYDSFEEILRNHIKNLGEINESYETVPVLSDLNFVYPEINLPTNLALIEALSSDKIYEFALELRDFIKKLVEHSNFLISYYNSLAYNSHWDDIQHNRYGDFFMVLTKKLTKIIEIIKTALTDLNLNIIPVYNRANQQMQHVTFP